MMYPGQREAVATIGKPPSSLAKHSQRLLFGVPVFLIDAELGVARLGVAGALVGRSVGRVFGQQVVVADLSRSTLDQLFHIITSVLDCRSRRRPTTGRWLRGLGIVVDRRMHPRRTLIRVHDLLLDLLKTASQRG
jgi:hypothetical protein